MENKEMFLYQGFKHSISGRILKLILVTSSLIIILNKLKKMRGVNLDLSEPNGNFHHWSSATKSVLTIKKFI